MRPDDMDVDDAWLRGIAGRTITGRRQLRARLHGGRAQHLLQVGKALEIVGFGGH